MIKILAATYHEGELNEARHYHDCHQILFVKDGSVEVRLKSGTYEAKSGSLVFLNRFEEHAVCVKSGKYCRYVLNVSPKIDETGAEYKLFSILFNRPIGFCNLLHVENHIEEFEDIFLRIQGKLELKESFFRSRHSFPLQVKQKKRHVKKTGQKALS